MAVDLLVAPAKAERRRPPGPRHRRKAAGVPRLRRLGVHLGVIALFTLPAVALWWRAWSGGAASTVRCSCLDPGQQVWFVSWPAYALSHDLNPFSTTWLWPQGGVNLLANASAPLVGLVLTPVTWIFGPFAATTLALTLAPGLSAWGCWVACRRLVAWPAAWWVAGLVFGYSPFVVESVGQGHLSTGLLVFPPLMVVVLHEILVRQRWSPARCAAALAALVLAQFLVSPEMLTISVVAAIVGVAAAAALAPKRAAQAFPFALRALALAGAASLLVLAAPAWYLLDGRGHISGPVWGALHTIFVAQAWEIWSAGPWRAAIVPGVVQGPQLQFLGFGLLLVGGGSLAVAWRRRAAWLMAIAALSCTVLSWGNVLWLSPGHEVVSSWLPWGWVTNLPVFDDVNAIHVSALADLAVALLVAVGLDALVQARPWRRAPTARIVLLPCLVALVAVPVWRYYDAPLSVQRVALPQWFATAARTVPVGSVVATYPFPASASLASQPMVWQAADSMRFRLAGGYVKVPGRSGAVIGQGPPGSAVRALVDLTLGPSDGDPSIAVSAREVENLRTALQAWGTSYIVVTDTGEVPVEAAGVFTAATGRLPSVEHRAWVWDLRHQPLDPPSGGSVAAHGLAACEVDAGDLGAVPAGHPLPQALDRCVAAAVAR